MFCVKLSFTAHLSRCHYEGRKLNLSESVAKPLENQTKDEDFNCINEEQMFDEFGDEFVDVEENGISETSKCMRM